MRGACITTSPCPHPTHPPNHAPTHISWSAPVQYDPVLLDPVCEASLLRIGDAVLFSNPASKSSRANMTIRRGTGDIGGWQPDTLLVAEGATWGGYSSMAGPLGGGAQAAREPLADAQAGILWEQENAAGTPVIRFAAFGAVW